MTNVLEKDGFINELKKFTTVNTNDNITTNFSNNIITINETEKDGQGEIYLDISSSDKNTFFIKIDNQSKHNIGIKSNHNDGIVLKINLSTKNISVFFVELKKQLRFNKLEKASTQLSSAYRFIKYLRLEECFEVNYKFFIVYEINNLEFDSDILKTNNKFQLALFNAIYEQKDILPLKIPLCKFKEYNFKQLRFGETIPI